MKPRIHQTFYFKGRLRCHLQQRNFFINSFTVPDSLDLGLQFFHSKRNIHFILCLLCIIICYYTILLLPAGLQLPGERSHPGSVVCPGPTILESCVSVRLCRRLFLTFRSLVRSEDEQSKGNVCPLAKIPGKSESAPPQKCYPDSLSLLVLERMAPKKN